MRVELRCKAENVRVALIEVTGTVNAAALSKSIKDPALQHDALRVPKKFADGDLLRCRRCMQPLVFATAGEPTPATLGLVVAAERPA